MMWNWLASGLASDATLVALRRFARPRPASTPLWRPRRRARHHAVRHVGEVPRRAAQGRAAAGRRPRRSSAVAHDHVDRVAARRPRASSTCTTHVKADVHLRVDLGWHRPLRLPRRRRPDRRRCGRARSSGRRLGMDDRRRRTTTGRAPRARGAPASSSAAAPFPSMPLRLLGRPRRRALPRRVLRALSRAAGTRATSRSGPSTAGIVIHGRSDATLNPGGVRIGTAEIYRQVEALDEVVESLVIGQQWDDDVRVVLFVVLRDGVTLDDDLRGARSATGSARGASPRHVPARDRRRAPTCRAPAAASSSELAVRDVVDGRPVANVEALANPEALDAVPRPRGAARHERDRGSPAQPAVRAGESARRRREAAP